MTCYYKVDISNSPFSLGYKNKTISIQEIKSLNYLITLEESINELNTVYVSNKRPNADSIMARVRQNISKNKKNQKTKKPERNFFQSGSKFCETSFKLVHFSELRK